MANEELAGPSPAPFWRHDSGSGRARRTNLLSRARMLLSQLNLAQTLPSVSNSEDSMTCSRSRAVPALGLMFIFAVLNMAANAQATTTWAPVEEALGRTGAAQPGGVMKFAF